jgi:TPR repeat protein
MNKVIMNKIIMNKIIVKLFILTICTNLITGCIPEKWRFSNWFKTNKKTMAKQSVVAPSEEDYYNEQLISHSQSKEMLEKLAKANDPHASYRLGEIHLHGIGTAKDPQLAMQWFKKAAVNGLPGAMLQVGHMYRDGIGDLHSLDKAILWYRKATNQGNINAMLALGDIYRGIYALQPDYNKAMEWYITAAGMGSLEAEYQMTRLITNDLVDHNKYGKKINSVLASLKNAAAEGDLDATVAVADHYMQQKNTKLALEYYHSAADDWFPPALLRLGLLYLHGESVAKDYAKALDYFTQAANAGNVASQYHLGEMYRTGLGVDKDAEVASYWYDQAAHKNFPKAIARLADLYFTGAGISPDLYKALDLYTKAANAGDSYAGLLLSIFYAKGIIVEQNLATSMHWYNTVELSQDHLLAKFEIGKAYEFCYGLTKNYKEALHWYLLSARGGLPKAQTRLAELHIRGLGTLQNYKQGIHWYTKAAEQNYGYAQYSLGILLQNKALNGLYNPKSAYNFMNKAAMNGYKPAQYNLAIMLLEGTGIKADPVKACSWLHISLDNGGYESNPELMAVLIDKLNPKARNKAISLVKRYKEQYNFPEQQEY